MNRMMEAWKEIPERDLNPSEFQPNSLKGVNFMLILSSLSVPKFSSLDLPAFSISRCCLFIDFTENANDGRFPHASVNSSSSVQSSSPFFVRRSRRLTSRSPPPTSPPIPSSVKKIVRPNGDLKPNSASSRRISQAKSSDWGIEVSVPDGGIKKDGKNGEQGRGDGSGINGRPDFEARRVLFEKNCEEKKMDGLKPGVKAAPLLENGSLEVTAEAGDELIVEQRDSDLSLIRMQLAQIEKQQSTLLELLQVSSLS